MGNKFKPSLYNFYYEIENEVTVYNSLTNGLAVIEKKLQYFNTISFDIREMKNDEVIEWLHRRIFN